jgi:hypothetical protein
MSLVYTNTPTEFQPVLSDGIYFTLSSSTYDAQTTYKFRYVYELEVDGDIVFSGKCSPNPFGIGIVDLQQVLETYTDSLPVSYWDTTPIYTHQTIGFSRPANFQVLNYRIVSGYEYADSPIAPITGFTGVGSAIGDPAYASSDYKVFRSTMGTNGRATQQSFDIGPFVLSGSPTTQYPTETGLFLTNAPRWYDVTESEYYTLGFTNYYLWSGGTTGLSEPYYVNYEFFDDQGTLITGYTMENITTNGGGPRTNCNQVYQQLYLIDPISGETEYNTLYVGAGPQNLPVFPPNTAQYTVQLFGLFEGATTPIPVSPTPTPTPTQGAVTATPTPTPSPTPICGDCNEYTVEYTGESSSTTITITNCNTGQLQNLVIQKTVIYVVCSCGAPFVGPDVDVQLLGPCFAGPTPTPTTTRTPTPTPSACVFKSWEINECGATCSGGICACEASTPVTVYTTCDVTDITNNDTQLYDTSSLTSPWTGDFVDSGRIWNSSGANVTLVCIIGGPC